jgi:hypothetical protein
VRRSDLSQDQGLRHIAPKELGGHADAHQGLGLTVAATQGDQRRGSSGGSGRRSWGGLLQGSSGLLIPTGLLGMFLQRFHEGQGGPGVTGGEKSQGRDVSLAAGLSQIPATAGVEVDGRDLGKLPSAEVELMRALAGAGVQRGGRSTVGQEAWCGGARRRWC